MSELSELGEDAIIARLTKNAPLKDNIIVGPGDDCAVMKNGDSYSLLKTDTIIEGVHYLSTAEPFWVGWKAAARVVSDIAAMGGTPDAFVIALAMSQHTSIDYLEALYQGIYHCAETYSFSVVGGETSHSDTNTITISGTGTCSSYVTRSNANLGDHLYVTGKLGGSISGKHLTFKPRLIEAQWLCQQISPTAMMDLSDGLAKDLPRLCKLSEVGYTLDLKSIPCNENLPIKQALTDGEDYELLFSCSHEIGKESIEEWQSQFPNLALTKIGSITEEKKPDLDGGWEHFK